MAIFANTSFGSGQATLFNCGRATSPSGISVTAESGGLKVKTPFDANFVAMLKAEIPAMARKWDPPSKCWYVSVSYQTQLKQLIDTCFNCDVQMPTVIGADNTVFEITFQADYIANTKTQGSEAASSVHANGSWSAKISEKVLRAWFKQEQTAGKAATYYALLGCDEKATERDIKVAFKRAARQWHPDLCKEPEARDMFEKVKTASEVLLNFESRSKYDAGLFFEKLNRGPQRTGRGRAIYQPSVQTTFTPLLRCGLLTVKARRDLGNLIVEEILKWEDIENEIGQTMVSFWAGDTFSVMWI